MPKVLEQILRQPRWLIAIALTLSAAVSLLMGQSRQRTGPLIPVRLEKPAEKPLEAYPMPEEMRNLDLMRQAKEVADQKSIGCISCHKDSHDPHFAPHTTPLVAGSNKKPTFHLGCVDCHGGDPSARTVETAHPKARFPHAWKSSANPIRSYTLLNHEDPQFIKFVNPGDLRIAHLTCGNCHEKEVLQVRTGMMTHGCMLWGAALYNNGAVPFKRSRYGESYSMHGVPQRLQTWPPPTEHEMRYKGVVPFLEPLPRFEISQPGNILRIFERGGRFRPETAIPEREEESGRPRTRLSIRGLGTETRTDPVFVGLQRTRLLDPTLNFLGTNDHPGDYRSSGCTACHVVYANDRSRINSGPYAKYGHLGKTANPDPTIPRDESGHPIHHKFTRAIPSSQCMVCHMHPGTTVMNSYLGYMWWDEETDGEFMYPAKQKNPTAEEYTRAVMSNPDEASVRGLWSDPKFLEKVSELNPHLKHTQFADFHGHGWVYRAVFKKDRHGNYLDHLGRVLPKGKVTAREMAAAMIVPEYVREQNRVGNKTKMCDRDGLPVHLMDIHLEKGMHCADCHFVQDVHGNTKLYGEVRAAIEIQCIDCHGTITQYANLRTSGPASPRDEMLKSGIPGEGGRNLAGLRTPSGKRRFEWRSEVKDGKVHPVLIQRSMVEENLEWKIVQTKDTITPGHPSYSERARLAKTVRFKKDPEGKVVVDEKTKEPVMEWGDIPLMANGQPDESACAHQNKNMSCIACHSSWNPSCFGCHLPQRADKKMPHLHFEGDVTRNYISYNFQTLRDDVYMLARDGDVTGNRIGPARSSCAIHVGSYNNNRDSVYVQQQTISAEGPSGLAFSTNVPHTVRGGPPKDEKTWDFKTGRPKNPDAYKPGHSETKSCTDCHVSKKEDNNAVMAQLLMQGTGYTNFMGRYCWVAAKDHGLFGVIVTEQDEPQAVIGSHLHRLAFPDHFKKHQEKHLKLHQAHEHPGLDIIEKVRHPFSKANILQVQPRGEYLYAACGEYGLRVFDIAFIDNKSFAERITTAPFSPFGGQRFYVRTKYAAAVASPCTPAPDPTRTHREENKEPTIHGMYGYLYVADKYEGLILVGAATTIDGNPTNNFLKRDVTFNPDGILNGAKNITIAGTFAYICCDAGLVVVSIADPKEPKVTAVIGEPDLHHPSAVSVQFRYAFVCDDHGIAVLDVTDLAQPKYVARNSHRLLHHAHNIYLARTYAYVAAGKHGLVILNIENPTRPTIDQVYNANGCINDLHDVKLGITYVSEFAYLADGKNGLRVLQLTSPETHGNYGYSPKPDPKLIATYPIPHHGHALSIGRAVDRDRAIDESGNQIAVFGRIGARPLNFEEQRKLYYHHGQVWRVSDDPREYPEPLNPK